MISLIQQKEDEYNHGIIDHDTLIHHYKQTIKELKRGIYLLADKLHPTGQNATDRLRQEIAWAYRHGICSNGSCIDSETDPCN